MMTTSLAVKLTAGAAAAALTTGGALAATGELPDPAQRTVADGAARFGLDLPGASVGLDADGHAEQDGADTGSVTDTVVDTLTGATSGSVSGSGEGHVSDDGSAEAETDLEGEVGTDG